MFGGAQSAVRVDRAAIGNAGGGTPWNHLRAKPTDMFIRGSKSGRVLRVVATSHPYYVPSWTPYGGTQPYVDLDDAAINACNHLDCTPWGSFDSATGVPGGVKISGWAMDPEVITPIGLHIYVDGKCHPAMTANVSRTDVDAVFHRGDKFGFSGTLFMAAGSRKVCVYGLDAGAFRGNTEIGCKTLTVPAPVVPSAPASVVGSPGSASATVASNAPSSNGGAAVDSYEAVAAPGGAKCATTGAKTCAVTGLVNGTSYTFTVRAHNTSGWSPASPASAAVVPTAPEVAPPAPGPEARASAPVTDPGTATPTTGGTTADTAPPPAVVKAKPKKSRSRLYVDVNPHEGSGYWKFQVQKLRPDQTWARKKTYRTKGPKERRTIDLKKGTHRVVVKAK